MKPLKIIFAGSPAFGLPCLEALHDSHHEIVALYTQPDRKVGRGQKTGHSAIKQWGIAHGYSVEQPQNFKDKETLEIVRAHNADLMVVIAYGIILPQSLLTIPSFGCINVHASILPAWRGASPIQQSILNDDKKTGVTIMQMDKGMDTGDILKVQTCTIEREETSISLSEKLANLAVKPLLEVLNFQAIGNPVQPIKQDNSQATYAPKILKQDGKINWSKSAISIECMIRAYKPWPIAYTLLNGHTIRIYKAVIETTMTEHAPGTIIDINASGIFVATNDGVLVIQALQFPSKNIVLVKDWFNAHQNQIKIGDIFS